MKDNKTNQTSVTGQTTTSPPPPVPTSHPNNPYVYNDITSTNANNVTNNNNSPMMDSVMKTLNSWSKKAEVTANNIWHNLNTAPSPSSAAWDKLNLNAKAITGGGFDTIYKHSFSTFPNEKLNKTFACYLSKSTGPISGTLFLSNIHLAFCSDRPISYTSPSTQLITWSHYKVIVSLAKIVALNPAVTKEASSERYLQVVTVDGYDFWFMGFVNFEKAARYITQSLGSLTAHGVPLQPAPSN